MKLISKVKFSRYRPGVAQRAGRSIALLFHDCGTRRWLVLNSTPRPSFTPGKDPVPILQETRWAPGPVWTGGKSRPHWDSIPDCPVRSQSLYWLSYPAHVWSLYLFCIYLYTYLYSVKDPIFSQANTKLDTPKNAFRLLGKIHVKIS